MGIAEARETIRACKHCFMCRYRSPGFMATKLESLTPHGYAILLSGIDMGTREWTDEVAEKFFQSPVGGECRQDCEYHWPEDEMILHAREEIVKAKRAPRKVQDIAASVLEFGSPYGARGKWLEQHDRGEKAQTDVVFLAGETLEHDHPDLLGVVVRLFKRTGKSWTTLRGEGSGVLLHDLGYVDEARSAGLRLVNQINSRNASTVVTACPHTLSALRSLYPKWGIDLRNDIRLMHTTEFFAEQLLASVSRLGMGRTESAIAYHDCAELGRRLGIFDSPREIIGAVTGQPPSEFHRAREGADSSGAGCSLFITYPALSTRIAEKTLEGLPGPDVTTVATACPNCRTSLKRAAASRHAELQVIDVMELLVDSLERTE